MTTDRWRKFDEHPMQAIADTERLKRELANFKLDGEENRKIDATMRLGQRLIELLVERGDLAEHWWLDMFLHSSWRDDVARFLRLGPSDDCGVESVRIDDEAPQSLSTKTLQRLADGNAEMREEIRLSGAEIEELRRQLREHGGKS